MLEREVGLLSGAFGLGRDIECMLVGTRVQRRLGTEADRWAKWKWEWVVSSCPPRVYLPGWIGSKLRVKEVMEVGGERGHGLHN